MKRFVTYLYECQRGNKSKNVGFIRVNVRDGNAMLEVYLRNVARAIDNGKLFVLIYKEGLLGLELEEIQIQNGQCDCKIAIDVENINENNILLEDIEGIGIRLDSGLYIASCWKDTYADVIVRGEFIEEKKVLEEREEEREEVLVASQDVSCREEIVRDGPYITYERIDLSQIRDLPSPNWYLATNSFLVHGFWNYGYLVLKKNLEENKKTFSLGVPGIYEKPEAVMAMLFGFPNFEEVSTEMVETTLYKEKNQETEAGTFGCWFVDLKM